VSYPVIRVNFTSGDQVRVYPLDAAVSRAVTIVGARTIEERQDFWIVS